VIFWRNIAKSGRVNEMELSLRLYFMDGFVKGVKKGLEMAGVGLGMLRTGRLNPFGLFAHKGCKGKKDIQKMLKRAYEIEAKRKQFA